jgi:hypothetical protein
MLDSRQLEPALTEKEILLRDAFVSEYLKDFDAYRACLRLGFQATYATQWSTTLFQDGYVQRKLAHIMAQPTASPEQEAMDRALLENTLRLVMQRGSDAARVSAAREFRALKGWGEGEGGAVEDLSDQYRRLAQALPT